jgi:hypothetical protein
MKHMSAVRVICIPEDENGDFATAFVRLAARIADFQCSEHGEHASLITVFRSRAGISACCDPVLDRVEKQVGVKQ